MSVMVVKVLLKAWSPVTGPGAGEEEDEKDGGHKKRKGLNQSQSYKKKPTIYVTCVHMCPILDR